MTRIAPSPEAAGLGRHAAAWAVHLFTASGAVVGFLALAAVHRGRTTEAFAWLAVALAIDAVDGALARAVGVKWVVPRFDGARLDDIIDFLNYTVVPLALVAAADRLPPGLELPVAAAVLIASAYGFCQLDAKTSDGYFKGFPSYWNVVAFYIVVLDTPPWFNAAVLTTFAVLVFVPTYYLYPSRATRFRALTIGLGALWAVASLVLLAMLPHPPRALALISLLYPIYYMGLSFYLTVRR
jgi:phosphatidylcholine synthase